LNANDQNALTDMRVDLVKAALQLTPEQEKYWPAVESAIRAGAEDRKARIAKIEGTVVCGPTKAVSKSCAIVTPSPFYNDARKHWLNDPPIWISSPRRGSHSTICLVKQRQRMAGLAIFVLREMSDAADRRRATQSEENED
jgi:hypothetical protein